MAYRNGTYVAFNGCGTTNPTESDMKYYGLLQKWNKEYGADLNFSDSHDKTYSVRDSSKTETLKRRLLERLKNSKHIVLIVTENSSWNRGLLNWEIEKAVEQYKIPLIVAHTTCSGFISSPKQLAHLLPEEFKNQVAKGNIKAIHVPFRKRAIGAAIRQFGINNQIPDTAFDYYIQKAYIDWDYR